MALPTLIHSQLLQKLNANDKAASAEEFLEWKKITVGGKEVVCEERTRRLHTEGLLFLSKTNDFGREFIQECSKRQLEAYRCPSGRWTIGYGRIGKVDGKPIVEGMKITPGQAELLFIRNVYWSEKVVERLVKVKLDEKEFAPLVSIVFHIGDKHFENLPLLKLLNDGIKMEDALAKHEEERELFLKNSDVYIAAGSASDPPANGASSSGV